MFKYLLTHGANVNHENHKGSTPLHFLCYQTEERPDDVTMLRKLIQHGANIHARDLRGMTPFLVCCTSGRYDNQNAYLLYDDRLDLITLLLEEGADPTVVDNDHHTAYKIAEFYNQPKVMERFADDTPVSRFRF